MQVIDLRLVVEDGVKPNSLLRLLQENLEDMLGGALLVNNGFGHLLPEEESILAYERDNPGVRAAILDPSRV